MFLELNNFCCYPHCIFTIPDYGNVLINGPSGVGKSTILNAIYFVLYGEGKMLVKDCNKKNKCFVRMKYKNVDITRTKNPERLTLMDEKHNEKEDDEAQAFINTLFGTNFILTSYVPQKSIKTFLHKSPSEKTNFILSLAFPGEDAVATLKKNARIKANVEDVKITDVKGKISVVELEKNQITKKIKDMERGLKPKTEEKVKTEQKKLFLNIDVLGRKIAINEKTTFSLRQYQIKVKEWILRKKDLEERKNNIVIEEVIYPQEIDDIPVYEKKISLMRMFSEYLNVSNRLSQAEKKRNEYLADFKTSRERRIKELNEEIYNLSKIYYEDSQEKEFLYLLKSLLSLKKSKDDYDKMINIYPKEDKSILLSTYNNETKKNNKCPKCGVRLNISSDGNITLCDRIPLSIEELHEIKSKIDFIMNNEKKFVVLCSKYEEYNNVFNKLVTISNKNTSLKIPSDQELLSYIDSLDQRIKENNETGYRMSQSKKQLVVLASEKEIPKHIKSLEQDISQMRKSFTKLKLQIGSNDMTIVEHEKEEYAVNEVKRLSLLKLEYQHKKEMSSSKEKEKRNIEKEIVSIDTQMKDFFSKPFFSTIRKELEEEEGIKASSDPCEFLHQCVMRNTGRKERLELKLSNSKHKYTLLQKYDEYYTVCSEYKKWDRKYNEFLTVEKDAEEKLALYKLFMKEIIKTENMIIQNIVNNINSTLEIYLEKFFRDEPLNIKMKTMRTDGRPNIFFEMRYKGNDIDMTTLSGGEWDRVCLALVLTFNKLFGSPFLLLDESISSLDEELCGDVLQEIRKLFTEKLVIIVAHQIEKGSFDKVIELPLKE